MDNNQANEPIEDERETARQTMARLRKMFAASGSGAYDEPGVVCPFCPAKEYAYPHIERRVNFLGGDYEASGKYNTEVRGDVTALQFYNETCLHRWALTFGEHKGAIFVRVVRLPDRSIDG